jgi:transposase
MCKYILGIDISKSTFDIALLDDDDNFATGQFKNSQHGVRSLQKWLQNRGVKALHACMEATGRYGNDLAAFLVDEGYDVSMVNPARIRAYGQSKLMRTKTDKTDAMLIADFCATQSPSLWVKPSVYRSELQSLTRYLDDLKRARNQEMNRNQSGVPSAAVRRAIQEHIDFLNQQIKEVEKEIKDLIDSDEENRVQFELLTSIPGIGFVTAATFLAEVPNISDFAQARHLASYAGLCPKHHQSGSSVRKKARLSKTGNPYLRKTFYMPAIAILRGHNPLIQPLIERMQQDGRKPMVIVGAVMRKLLHLAYGVLKTGKPFDPNYLSGTISA